MKKTKNFLKKHYKLIVIIFLIILLFPIKLQYLDGGSVSYNAILYKYIIYRPNMLSNFNFQEEQKIFKFFPKNFHSLEYYLELKPEKKFAYIYPRDFINENELDYVECNTGNYNIVRFVDKEKLEKEEKNAIAPAFQDYKKQLLVKNDDIIYIERFSEISEIKVYKPYMNHSADLNISIYKGEGDMGIKLNNIEKGTYIISFKTTLEESECWYSFQINVL